MIRIFLGLFLFIGFAGAAQSVKDSIPVNNFIVREGALITYDYSRCHITIDDPNVYILTKEDSAFHFENGTVVSVFNLGDEFDVLIKNYEGYYLCYGNLISTPLKKNDTVFAGSFIGLVNKSDEEEKFNEIVFLLHMGKKNLSPADCIRYLQGKISEKKSCSDFKVNYL